jgi:2-dehydropantoate 2-reductase
MRICIVGCGAIGGLYAAHLAQLPDVEVWAYDVMADHVAAIERGGLRVTGRIELTARVHARVNAAEIPPCELGIVAVKGTVTEPAIAATAHLFGGGAVCSVQNGIGNEEVLADHVPGVIRGVTLPAGRLLAPGLIHMDAPGTTWIGPFEPRPAAPEAVQRLGSLLNAAGMPTEVLADARPPQWTKLLFNAATNPLCALTGLSHGQLCALPVTRRLVGSLVEEGRAVAHALSIGLDADPEALIDEAARTNFAHRPSMLQDAEARRPTEIATLNGAIADEGRRAGVPTPRHDAILALIRGLEHSWTVA